MTNPLGAITNVAEMPLEFTRHMAQVFQDNIIGALSKPLPSTDPLAAYRYNEARARTLQNGFKQRPLLRMQDKNLQQFASIGGERSVRFEEIATDTGEAGVVLRGGDYLSDFVRNAVRLEEDLHLSIDINPLRLSHLTRWGGKITTINAKRDSSGIHTVELIASAQREHLKHVLVGTTPFFPPEVQPLSLWMLPANCRTACASTLFINLMRQFEPGLSTITNIMNPFGWLNPFGPDALLNFNPMQWPIQVQFVNAALDQSRTTVFTGAWNDFHTASLDTMRDAGVCARAYTCFTDDVDNPQPELAGLMPTTPLNSIPIVGSLVSAVEAFLDRTGLADIPENATVADLARPQRNCVMVAFEDHSGYSGPTGTAADGVINLFASTLDDLITTTVIPIDADDDGEVDPLFRKILGVAPPPPWAIYRDGQHSGIIESNYTQHKGPVKTVMTGGKSPKLVNDLQTFLIKWGLSQLQTVITAGMFANTGGPPIGAGLDELYQGQLDNKLLAWQRYTDPLRALVTGDLGYLESFERGNAAYTISAILTLRQGNWKTRAFRSFKTSIRQSAPYIIYYDILLDDRVGFEQDGILYVDQAHAIKYEYDRNKPITFTVSVGDDTKDQDPFSQGIKALQGLGALIGAVIGGDTLFG
ncbi:hypothetical protein [Mycobacterium intracellulare]|uniref:Gp37-like protein n=1 Tax=Mycobacterium intracellulare TaxID=1767 RepID=UPI00259A5C6C|nr:hypothetical protein [Mycobacterium intracellulare]MDM3894743.1 hypothetical protein [Mycobacterium intracellulare]